MSGSVEKALAFITKKHRGTVTVVVLLAGLTVASFSAWGAANARGEAFVDKCIDTKVGPQLTEQAKDIAELKAAQAKYSDDVAGIHTDVAVIRQTLIDMKEQQR